MSKKDLLSKSLENVIRQKEKNDEDIKRNIVIWSEFESLIPALQNHEKEQLEENILAEGCREALLLWKNEENYVLIDGHNRYELCQKHGIDFKILVKDFESMEAAKSFMINNQLGRRNLTPEQMSYLRGKRYESEKLIQGGTGANQYKKLTAQEENGKYANFAYLHNTQERLAQEHQVSKRTIMNDALFAKAIDKIGEANAELKKEILSGKSKITKSQVQELAKMEKLPSLETIEDLENLFQTDKNKVFDQLKTKKDHLVKIIKNNDFDLMSLEQIEKFCLEILNRKIH